MIEALQISEAIQFAATAHNATGKTLQQIDDFYTEFYDHLVAEICLFRLGRAYLEGS